MSSSREIQKTTETRVETYEIKRKTLVHDRDWKQIQDAGHQQPNKRHLTEKMLIQKGTHHITAKI